MVMQSSAQKHLFVGNNIRKSHLCRISDLRPTGRKGFWATTEAASEMASTTNFPVVRTHRRFLTNPDLSSHAINQFLGIVAHPGLEHRLDVLDLFNAL